MDDLKIIISATINKDAENKLQQELDNISKKLKLTIQNASVAGSKTSQSYEQSAKSIGRYESGLNNLIHLYKMKEVTDRKFLDTMELMKSKTQFTTLSLQKQEQVMSLLEKAEKNYQKVSDQGINIRKQQAVELEKKNKINKETIGTFQQLTGEQVKSADVAKVLSQQYGNLEVRGHSLNQTTGAYNVTLKQNAKENLVLKGTIDQSTGALRVQNQVVEQARNIQLGLAEQFKIAISRSITWGVAMGVLYGNLRKLREGLSFLVELDKQLTEISMITGITRDQTRELAQEYAILGREIGKTVLEISAVNKELIRQGLSIEVAKDRLEAILKLSATANITTEQSLAIITSSVNAMGEAVDKTTDVLLKAGAVSASSVEQIGEAFTKTASSAKATGVSIENLTALLATMIEITQESPSSLGNSMKTLLARFNKINQETGELNTEINQVQKAFESVNVTFLDSAGQIRSVDDLLDDLSEKWLYLDKNTKLYIATQAAGVRQQNRFLAIMENYNRTQEIQNELVDVAGTTNKQYAEYLNSVEAAANRAKVAVEQMWLNTINSDLIKQFYNFSASLTTIIDNLGLLKVSFSALLTILILSSTTFKNLRTNIADNAKTMKTGQLITNSFSNSMVGLQIKTVAATVAVNALYAAITFGLSFAIAALGSYIANLIKKHKELKIQQDLMVSNLRNNREEIDKLVESYKNLYDIVGKSEEQEQEYIEIKNRLAELFPTIKAEIDEEGNARLKNIDIIEREINKVKELDEEKRKERMKEAEGIYTSNIKEIETLQEKINELENDINKIISNTEYDKLHIGLRKYIDNIREDIDNLKDSFYELKNENFDVFVQHMSDSFSELGVVIDNRIIDTIKILGKELTVTARFPIIINRITDYLKN